MQIDNFKKFLNKKNIILFLLVTVFNYNIVKANNNEDDEIELVVDKELLKAFVSNDLNDLYRIKDYNCGSCEETCEANILHALCITSPEMFENIISSHPEAYNGTEELTNVPDKIYYIVKELGFDINKRLDGSNSDSYNAMDLAIKSGNYEAAKGLIISGFDMNQNFDDEELNDGTTNYDQFFREKELDFYQECLNMKALVSETEGNPFDLEAIILRDRH